MVRPVPRRGPEKHTEVTGCKYAPRSRQLRQDRLAGLTGGIPATPSSLALLVPTGFGGPLRNLTTTGRGEFLRPRLASLHRCCIRCRVGLIL
jgi:hypothetical protein